MKKYLIFLFIISLFLLPSCKNKSLSFIESSKVSCYEDINTSSKTLYLNIYTSTNLNNLNLKDNNNYENYEIVFKTLTKYIYEEKEIDAIFYQFKIVFYSKQLSITHIDFINNNSTFNVEIGKYQLVKMPVNDSNISGVIDINDNNLILYIHNGLERTIYLTKISSYLVNHEYIKINKHKIDDSAIYEGNMRFFKLIQFMVPSDLLVISGMLKVEFTTYIKNFVIYVYYCYNKVIDVSIKEKVIGEAPITYFHIFYKVHINAGLM